MAMHQGRRSGCVVCHWARALAGTGEYFRHNTYVYILYPKQSFPFCAQVAIHISTAIVDEVVNRFILHDDNKCITAIKWTE